MKLRIRLLLIAGCAGLLSLCVHTAVLSGRFEASAVAQQAAPAAASPVPGIFSALLGSSAQTQADEKDDKDDAINGTALLQALLNARK